MAKRTKYSEEFKREAVGLIRQPHANVSQIAQDIDVSANDLWRWHRVVSTNCSSRKTYSTYDGICMGTESIQLHRCYVCTLG